VEVVVRHALRSDVCAAQLETLRALAVLPARLVLRCCDSAQDEYREDAKARSHVLFHRTFFLPASHLRLASQVVDLRRDGVAIRRAA
jgi:hypothetical protein